MSKNTAKKMLSALLAVLMIFSCVPFASAAHVPAVIDPDSQPEEWAKYVTLFSQYANSIKKDSPYCVVRNESGLDENGITVRYGGDDNYYDEEVDDKVRKWLTPVFDGMFKSNSSVALSFINTLLGDGAVNFDTRTFYKGENRDKYVPLYGSNSVSLLTPDDKDFTLTVSHDEFDSDRLLGIQVLYNVSEPAADADSSRSKVFSLSDGTIDPIIISGSSNPETKIDVKFKDFTYGRSKVNLYFDKDGMLSKYINEVPYEFTATLYDLLQVLDAAMKKAGFTFSFVETGILLADTILSNLGKTDITSEAVLSEYRLHIKYTVRTVIEEFNFSDRLFGDIDGDGTVSVSDARTALRHAVGLEIIKKTDGLIYGDVDFDGDIDVSDARLILRMAVGIDPTFSEIPDGKEIKIVVVNPDEPDEPGIPDEPDVPDPGEEPEKPDYSDLNKFPASVAQAVFDIINLIGGASGSFIDYIKAIIAAAKG